MQKCNHMVLTCSKHVSVLAIHLGEIMTFLLINMINKNIHPMHLEPVRGITIITVSIAAWGRQAFVFVSQCLYKLNHI